MAGRNGAGTRWTGKGSSTSWFDAANWTQGVPTTQEATAFSDGADWTISLAGPAHAAAGALTVTGDRLTFVGGTLDLVADQPNQGYPVDLAIGGGGEVSVAAGATLTSQYIIDVGNAVAGTLTAGTLAVHGLVDGAFLDVIDGRASISGTMAHVALITDGYSASVSDGTLAISQGGTLDVGPDSLDNNYSSLSIGSGAGDGVVTVGGQGSLLSLSGVIFGNDGVGTLAVRDGGAVHVNYVTTLGYGEAHISVSGTGAVLTAARGISIGDDGSLSGLTLSVTQGGSVSAGTYGVSLDYGVLVLDASAKLHGSITSQVGQIEAVAVSHDDPGTVTLGQSILLNINSGAQGQYAYATDVFSRGGAVLVLDGQISSINSATLLAGAGHVVLANGTNSYNATSVYDARLEIAATGAAGAGTMSFTGGASQTPVLQIDAGVAFANTIAGFGAGDTIDLRGFAFAGAVTDSLADGTLTLTDHTGSTSLSLAGTFAATSFAFASDHHGGTDITFTHG